MSTTATNSPIHRNFELEVRARRAEAIVALLSAGLDQLKKVFAGPPAARGDEALTIRRAWLRASA